jgi:hypothetical protein
MEIWKDIPNYEGLYQISSLGKVKRLKSYVNHWRGGKRVVNEKLLKQKLNRDGYYRTCLCKNNIKETKTIHLLMAYSFFNYKSRYGYAIDHIDNNKENNNINNLQILTTRENVTKGYLNKKTSSKFTGVTYMKNQNQYQSYIIINNKKKHLGTFDTELEASKAYINKLNEIKCISQQKLKKTINSF